MKENQKNLIRFWCCAGILMEKNVHNLNRITENAQTKEVKEGQKKKAARSYSCW